MGEGEKGEGAERVGEGEEGGREERGRAGGGGEYCTGMGTSEPQHLGGKRLGTEVQTCSPNAMKTEVGRSQGLYKVTKLLSSTFRWRAEQ